MSESQTPTADGSADPKHALRRGLLGRPRPGLVPVKAIVARHRPADR